MFARLKLKCAVSLSTFDILGRFFFYCEKKLYLNCNWSKSVLLINVRLLTQSSIKEMARGSVRHTFRIPVPSLIYSVYYTRWFRFSKHRFILLFLSTINRQPCQTLSFVAQVEWTQEEEERNSIQIERIDGLFFFLLWVPPQTTPSFLRGSVRNPRVYIYIVYIVSIAFIPGGKKRGKKTFTNDAATICHHWPRTKKREENQKRQTWRKPKEGGEVWKGVWNNTKIVYSQRTETPHTHHYFCNNSFTFISIFFSCFSVVPN